MFDTLLVATALLSGSNDRAMPLPTIAIVQSSIPLQTERESRFTLPESFKMETRPTEKVASVSPFFMHD